MRAWTTRNQDGFIMRARRNAPRSPETAWTREYLAGAQQSAGPLSIGAVRACCALSVYKRGATRGVGASERERAFGVLLSPLPPTLRSEQKLARESDTPSIGWPRLIFMCVAAEAFKSLPPSASLRSISRTRREGKELRPSDEFKWAFGWTRLCLHCSFNGFSACRGDFVDALAARMALNEYIMM